MGGGLTDADSDRSESAYSQLRRPTSGNSCFRIPNQASVDHGSISWLSVKTAPSADRTLTLMNEWRPIPKERRFQTRRPALVFPKMTAVMCAPLAYLIRLDPGLTAWSAGTGVFVVIG